MHTLVVKCYPIVDREEPTDYDPLYEYSEDVVSHSVRHAVEEVFDADSEVVSKLSKGADGNWYSECEDGLLQFILN